MQRRGFLGGLGALLLPGSALAQMSTDQMPQGQMPPGQMPQGQMPPGQIPPGQPPYGQAPRGRQGGGMDQGQPRTPVVQMSWSEIAPGRRRKLQQRLAGPGNPALPPDQAQQMWDGMSPQQRRQRLRATAPAGGGNRRQQRMDQPPQQ
jgi:hypothetical protein